MGTGSLGLQVTFFLGCINTLLSGLKLGHKFGYMGTGSLGLQVTFFLGSILDNCAGFVITYLSSFFESTACRGTHFPGLLGTSSDGSVLLDSLLFNSTDFSGPLGALGEGGVTRSFIITLLILDCRAGDNIILNIMLLLFSPTLRLILSCANFRSLDFTILDKGSSTDLNSLIEGNLLIINETILSEVLFTFFFLLRFIVSSVGGVTSSVIAMITLNNFIIFSLLNHFYLVNTTLAISARTSSGDSREADVSVSSLKVST